MCSVLKHSVRVRIRVFNKSICEYLEDTVRYSILKKYLRYDTDTRYRYFYRVSVSSGCIRLIGAGINVTCVLIDEFPVKFNSSG